MESPLNGTVTEHFRLNELIRLSLKARNDPRARLSLTRRR
jgi:hypothetical protein